MADLISSIKGILAAIRDGVGALLSVIGDSKIKPDPEAVEKISQDAAFAAALCVVVVLIAFVRGVTATGNTATDLIVALLGTVIYFLIASGLVSYLVRAVGVTAIRSEAGGIGRILAIGFHVIGLLAILAVLLTGARWLTANILATVGVAVAAAVILTRSDRKQFTLRQTSPILAMLIIFGWFYFRYVILPPGR